MDGGLGGNWDNEVSRRWLASAGVLTLGRGSSSLDILRFTGSDA